MRQQSDPPCSDFVTGHMKRQRRKPSPAAGKLAIAMGVGSLSIAVLPSVSFGEKCRVAGPGLILLSWGLREVAGAKKWKQEPEGMHYARTAEERRESELSEKLEKCGSMSNVLALLTWILLPVAGLCLIAFGYLMLFHRPR